jgi:hypothetical protein
VSVDVRDAEALARAFFETSKLVLRKDLGEWHDFNEQEKSDLIEVMRDLVAASKIIPGPRLWAGIGA